MGSEDATLPIPLYLTCPSCCARHIDEGEFATRPHHTHACQACGLTWRPAVQSTVGVAFLPGFKSDQHDGRMMSDVRILAEFVNFKGSTGRPIEEVPEVVRAAARRVIEHRSEIATVGANEACLDSLLTAAFGLVDIIERHVPPSQLADIELEALTRLLESLARSKAVAS